MTYKELQRTAKELGLPYVGVSRAELSKSISSAKPTETPPVEKPTVPVIETEEKSVEKPTGVNTAIVYNGNHEVRRYSLDMHGKNFADLAMEFIKDRKYTLKFVDVTKRHVCPACGHKYDEK